MVKLIYEDGHDFFLKKGDYVDLDFYVSGLVSAAQVVSLKTTGKDKVLVDVDVVIDYGPISKTKVRIHGIDSHCCRLRDEAYMKELNKDKAIHRTKHGSVFTKVYGPKDYPKIDPNADNADDLSVHVIIDINGKGEYFDTGWYNFDEKEWVNCNPDFTSEIAKKQFIWRYIDI